MLREHILLIWATMNENAAFQEPLTIEDAIQSKPISSPLHRSDCCLVTDGGGAVIITTEAKAKNLKTKPIYIKGFGETRCLLFILLSKNKYV